MAPNILPFGTDIIQFLMLKLFFFSSGPMRVHILARHTPRSQLPHQCQICPGKGFLSKIELQNHMDSKHNNGIRAYTCSNCGYSCKTQSHVKFHEKFCYQGLPVPKKTPPKKKPRNPPALLQPI